MFKSHPCGRTDPASLTSSARPQLSGTLYITFHVVMVADDCHRESVITGARRVMLRHEKLPIFGWASQVTAGSVSASVWFTLMPQFLAHVVRLMKLSERALLLGSHLPGRCGWWDEVQPPAASFPLHPSSNNKTVWYPLEAPKPPQFSIPHCLSHTAALYPTLMVTWLVLLGKVGMLSFKEPFKSIKSLVFYFFLCSGLIVVRFSNFDAFRHDFKYFLCIFLHAWSHWCGSAFIDLYFCCSG